VDPRVNPDVAVGEKSLPSLPLPGIKPQSTSSITLLMELTQLVLLYY